MLIKIFVVLRLNVDKNWKKKVEESFVIFLFIFDSYVFVVFYI